MHSQQPQHADLAAGVAAATSHLCFVVAHTFRHRGCRLELCAQRLEVQQARGQWCPRSGRLLAAAAACVSMCETYGVSCMCMCISWQCCTLCCNAPTLCCGLSPHVRSSVWQPVNCPLLCKFTNRTCQGHECIHVALCAQPSADHCCAQALSSVVGEAVNAAAGATCSLWPGLLSAC